MSAHQHDSWFYASSQGERLGPFSIRQLSALAGQGVIGPTTLVWNPGYKDWIRAEEIADLLTHAREPAPEPQPSTGAIPAETTPRSATPAGQNSVPPEAQPVPTGSSSSLLDLKPAKAAFIIPRIFTSIIVYGILGAVTAGILVFAEQSPLPALVVFALGSLFGIITSLVAYRKESYQLHEARIICCGGGLASDRTTEFEVRNITHVKLKLPWLRFKLFGVGNVIVQTAGNAKPVVMRAIHGPEAVYKGLWERMQRNGYDLSRSQLLHEERPAVIGILGEGFRAISSLFVAGIVLSNIIMEVIRKNRIVIPPLVLVVFAAFLVIAVLAFIVFRYLDYRRRVYRVYNDVVVYEEGFFTRHDAFIPYENISDANTRCTFFDRILGLYDVQVSCQGVGSEITFRRLKNGVTLSDAIDRVVVSARQKKKAAPTMEDEDSVSASAHRFRRRESDATPAGEILVGDFRMSAARTMVPLLLLFPLFPVWVIVMIQTGVRIASTCYSVRLGSLRHSYRFLAVHDREFAFEKITGVVIKRNLWDHMFGTMTLRFWSIGSGQPLEFAHVHTSALDLPALLRQVGIPASSPAPREIAASFGIWSWLRAHFNKVPLLLAAVFGVIYAAARVDPAIHYALGVPVLIVLAALIHGIFYYPRQRLRFHEHHIEAEQGILSKRRYLARYSNIKRSETTRYPGGKDGRLKIYVAGEEEVQSNLQQKKNHQAMLKQCSFTTGFVPEVENVAHLLDDILCGRVEPTPDAVAAEPLEVLLEARRSVGNALFELLLLSTIIFPMLVFLPLTIPSAIIRTRRWRYRIDAARVRVTHGLLYRRATSILLDRIDSLQQNQGPLNKMFGNGNVSIMTAGSSKPDLVLQNSPDYLKIHEVLRERSR